MQGQKKYTEEQVPQKLFLVYGEHDHDLYIMDTRRDRAEAILKLLKDRTKKDYYFKVTTNPDVIRDLLY